MLSTTPATAFTPVVPIRRGRRRDAERRRSKRSGRQPDGRNSTAANRAARTTGRSATTRTPRFSVRAAVHRALSVGRAFYLPTDVPSLLSGSLLSCDVWTSPQHLLFQLANGCFFVSYLAPSQRKGLLFMHGILILGFLLYSTWAWNIICAPDVFSWNFTFMLLNMGQTLYIIYQMRPVKVNRELEAMYEALFQPLNVPRLLFKRLVSVEYAQVLSLHAGEAYAMQNLTRTDRLGLLLSGKVITGTISGSHPVKKGQGTNSYVRE
ncbi:putative Popeye domain-containing protein [Penaeus vannamei]|uniref:Putative Popeye domain-containing protein n=1 Tax=Penaeus vannamei TaxID=6689 RepID=A0A423T0D3_PENVA|nr:putative Popeye domain-containing protein [Penaeus vannamei]